MTTEYAAAQQIDVEKVIGARPDVLMTGGTEEKDYTALAAKAEFAAFESGAVWSANKAMGPGGGNDFYERGVGRPDLILADLVAILHPDLAPGHTFTFYQQLTG